MILSSSAPPMMTSMPAPPAMMSLPPTCRRDGVNLIEIAAWRRAARSRCRPGSRRRRCRRTDWCRVRAADDDVAHAVCAADDVVGAADRFGIDAVHVARSVPVAGLATPLSPRMILPPSGAVMMSPFAPPMITSKPAAAPDVVSTPPMSGEVVSTQEGGTVRSGRSARTRGRRRRSARHRRCRRRCRRRLRRPA